MKSLDLFKLLWSTFEHISHPTSLNWYNQSDAATLKGIDELQYSSENDSNRIKNIAEITDHEKTSIPFSHMKLQKYRCRRQTVPPFVPKLYMVSKTNCIERFTAAHYIILYIHSLHNTDKHYQHYPHTFMIVLNWFLYNTNFLNCPYFLKINTGIKWIEGNVSFNSKI
jgi:hypothetical protein